MRKASAYPDQSYRNIMIGHTGEMYLEVVGELTNNRLESLHTLLGTKGLSVRLSHVQKPKMAKPEHTSGMTTNGLRQPISGARDRPVVKQPTPPNTMSKPSQSILLTTDN